MNSSEIQKELRTQAASMLESRILPFWRTRMVDEDQGGFYGRIDGEGILHPRSEKGIVLNTRILWTFSASAIYTGSSEDRLMAGRAYDYIFDHFIDTENGGVYWMLSSDGRVSVPKKQLYAQAFAIYALVEYYRLTKKKEVLAQAVELFNLVEKYAYDHKRNGYYEAFDEKWAPMEDVRLSEKDMNATKTMNTHLHILEAYTQLYLVFPDPVLKVRLANLMDLMTGIFLSANCHFQLFFDTEWNLLSEDISFGHDIEGSWLICEAAGALAANNPEMSKKALCMLDASMRGLDADGGLMNEADPDGLTDTDKHWWPQAEALVGLVNGWQISGDEKYLNAASGVFHFIIENLADASGEWSWKVSRNGEIDFSEDLAGPWKCPYHNGRAMLELIKRLS